MTSIPETSSGRFDRAIGRIIFALLAIGFLAVIVAGIGAAIFSSRVLEQSARVEHTQDVQAALADFAILVERKETSRRGYFIQQDARFLEVYEESATRIPVVLAQIEEMVSDNPEQVQRLQTLRDTVARHRSLVRRSLALLEAGNVNQAVVEFRNDASVQLTRDIRLQTQVMAAAEGRLLAERSAEQTRNARTLYWVLAIAGLLVLLVGAATLLTVRRYTNNLNRSRDALRDLNQNLEAAVEERTVDLQRANEEIQRFAYIVSHDLRSPLVNVMGFTSELDAARKPLLAMIEKAEAEAPDLVSEDAKLAAREDLPEAIGFIRTSTQKMDRLINAILKLSREGRRTIAPEHVDTRAMVQAIADSLKHRTDEIGADIRIADTLPALVTDRLALEQIFSNLIENATKYLKAGRPGIITVSGTRERGRAIFEITDNGRGIDPKDHQRIFDLFRRSGSQDQPGEGIGLAHVRSLAYRLGGVIDVESELGEGATFRLSLPLNSQGDIRGAA